MTAAISAPVRLHDHTALRVDAVGNKFARLAAARHVAVIPDASCLPTDWFIQALGDDRLARIRELFAELAATLGNEVAGLQPKLATILDQLALTEQMRTELAATLATLANDNHDPRFAVRSSSTSEDGAHFSHAGLYESQLDLAGLDEIQRAVVTCWHSFYSPRAILGRLRAGDMDPEPRMAVIIQLFVDSDLAGVAFTQDDQTVIEATPGTGDQVAAGVADPETHRVPRGADTPAPYGAVARLADTLRTDLGCDVDMEWAWDGAHVHLLQVRPVTARLHLQTTTQPVFTYASLYLDEALPPDLHLGRCRDIYLSYVAKRAPLYRLANAHGLRTGRGWVVALNGYGLETTRTHPDWWTDLNGQVVLDLGTNLRQHILPVSELPGFLTDALNLTGDPTVIHPLIVREFIQGEAGIITSCTPDGRTIVEYATQGLMAINRGLTEPERRVLPPLRDTNAWRHTAAPPGWHPDALRQLASFTDVLHSQGPGGCAEWVLSDGQPLFLDASLTASTPTTAAAETTVISAGTARGPYLRIDDSEELIKLSVAPIVSVSFRADAPPSDYVTRLIERIRELPAKPVIGARRPYVILSLLMDEVAGFVFEGGSTLCHLGLLLSEAKVPAVISPSPPTSDNEHIAIINNDTLRFERSTT